ncbi:MAG: HAMP domain-containing protein [Erysipelotrichaceae bacterium]|jgi:signal transduction histidine kinase|nr:HAMP domain-containing protein [Erysipelotrichaceae bacterium]
MTRSILFKKIILLLLSGLLLSGLLSAAIYIIISQKMAVSTQQKQLLPIARTIASLLSELDEEQEGEPLLPLWQQGNRNFLGASLYVFDEEGEALFVPFSEHPNEDFKPLSQEEAFQLIEADYASLLSGKELVLTKKANDAKTYLVVAVPFETASHLSGAVVFTRSLQELQSASFGLNLALVLSTLIAFGIMLIPGYFAARQLVIPIREMQEVAVSMSKGDFSKRADESQPGEIGELSKAMNVFAKRSEVLEQTRRDYVANISHELRTPIASIRAVGETLLDGLANTSERQEFFYSSIVRESMRLSRLVDDLLELSRLQSGQTALEKSPFDFVEILSNVKVQFAEKKELLVLPEVQDEINVMSNSDRIEQVLIILLDNAFKHGMPDSTVTVSITENLDHYQISVENLGEISPQDLPHLFERFYKADKAHSTEGTGLGLAIARELLKALKEEITVNSENQKTIFAFTLYKT